jgi:hypothetical protein
MIIIRTEGRQIESQASDSATFFMQQTISISLKINIFAKFIRIISTFPKYD